MRSLHVLLSIFSLAKAQFEGLDNLQEVLDSDIEQFHHVGIGASLFTKLEYLMKAQSGKRMMGSDTVIEFEDQWVMGSNTKSMVATVAAKVVEKGLIRWDTSVKELFHDSGLFEVNEGYWPSTLELFLSHGSGAPGLGPIQTTYIDLVDYIFNKTSWDEGYDNRAERMFLSETILTDPPFVPQYTFEYSIGGFTIAGAMLEVATNQTFEQLCTELLFQPLEMVGCGFGPTTIHASLPPTQPWGHLSDVFAYRNLPVPPSSFSNIASSMVPDGGIKCNLDSWRKYLIAHLYEDTTFLPADMWAKLHTPIVAEFYGFGWFIDNSNLLIGTVLTHGGTDGHNFANCVLLPRFEIGGNIATNVANTGVQSVGFNKVLEWMFTNILGREEAQYISSILDNTTLGTSVYL